MRLPWQVMRSKQSCSQNMSKEEKQIHTKIQICIKLLPGINAKLIPIYSSNIANISLFAHKILLSFIWNARTIKNKWNVLFTSYTDGQRKINRILHIYCNTHVQNNDLLNTILQNHPWYIFWIKKYLIDVFLNRSARIIIQSD